MPYYSSIIFIFNFSHNTILFEIILIVEMILIPAQLNKHEALLFTQQLISTSLLLNKLTITPNVLVKWN
jgi:hypothetical protein